MTPTAPKNLSVLLVEDSLDDARLVLRELQASGFVVTHERVTSAAELRAALAARPWDVILCDYVLPRFSGDAALQIVSELGCDTPFIFVSGTIGEDVAVNAMRAGAHDYVMKDKLARLAPAVERELREVLVRREARRADAVMRESEHKHRHLFESLSDAAFLFAELTGQVIDTNPAAETLLGVERHEILGRRHADFYAPATLAGAAVPGECEAEILRSDGTRVPVRVSTSRVQLHGRAFVLALVRDITARRRAAAALRESEALYRSVFTAMGEGLVYRDASGRIVAVNPVAEKILGHSAAALVGQPSTDLLRGAIREDGSPFPNDEHPSAVTLRTGQPQSEIIMGIRRPDGAQRWISVNSQPVAATPGETPRGVVTTFHDITEHRQAEAALRASEQRFSSVFCLSPTAISIIRVSDGRFVDANDAFVRAVGYTREELIGRTTPELRLWTSPDDREATVRLLHERGVIPVHRIIGRKKNGDRVVGLGATTTMMLNGEKHFLSLIHDITGLDRAEEALRESEGRFRQLAENIEAVFWLTDVEKSQMIYVSPAYRCVWGRAVEDLLENPQAWLDAIHPADVDRVRAAIPRQTAGGYDLEFRIVRPDGGVRWIHDRAFAIKDPTGKIYRIAGIAADVTARRQLEEQFRQAQKMEAVGQLAGGIAHDFNNLLTIVQMQSCFLLGELAQHPAAEAGLQQIIDAASRGAALTRQLLTFSRRQMNDDTRDVDLADLLSSMTKLLRRVLRENIELEDQFAAGLPPVRADPGMMEQVLMNLVINARDAMPQGGRLCVGLTAVVLDERAAAARANAHARPGRFLRLAVQDTGEGIAPEIMPRIFEPFFTTKEVGKGTGLGLATVFGIVHHHHGWIEVESTVGQGTTFSVFIPALDQPASLVRSAVAAPRVRGGRETILVVEDEDVVLRLATAALSRDGYTVIQARSGVEALAKWHAHQGPIDLILTDLMMPGGMSGQKLAAELRLLHPNVKVIYSSGYSAAIAASQTPLRAGWDYLAKPYSLHDLAAIVRQRLDEKPSPAVTLPVSS